MTYPNSRADSDSVNLGSNPGPPATTKADVSCVSAASGAADRSEQPEQTAHIGRTEVGTPGDVQSTIVGLRAQDCPGGGWNGQPAEIERATVADCLARGVCGCVFGDAVRHLETARAAPSPAVEIRPNDDGSIDEIVVLGCDLHIEQMSDDNWFLGITARDGSHWQFWIGAKNRRSHVAVTHYETSPAEVENAPSAGRG